VQVHYGMVWDTFSAKHGFRSLKGCIDKENFLLLFS